MVRKKKKEPEQQGNEELFLALALLEKERGVPVDFMLDKIKKAIANACSKAYRNEDVDVRVDPAAGKFEVYLQKQVVEEVLDPDKEMLLETARQISPLAQLGESVGIKLDTKQFSRVAAQSARNIIRQGIKENENGQMRQELQSKDQELVTALVERIDPRSGALSLRIGKLEVTLPKSEQIGNEQVREGDHLKVLVAGIKEEDKGPKGIISRVRPELVKRMFEVEVAEIYDGTVEIKAVSREAGSRTKLAVLSHDPNVDAVGACIGTRGARVNKIVEELGGEKIDIVEYSEDPKLFIAAALSPANVLSVELTEESKACKVTVPDSQLSLAIGNKGQNARLAARLTGWKIDIKPESGFFGEEAADPAP
ncbi:transcription termination factor NusA [Acutalibacter caecimuris]|uniref:transcription termination factor NusA n=1 Tax=Acutalibacter caecimuris TaxID=3093657 RepID=UPI002AC8E099|nr:transcription termination factor NusA [Acutalibacter sp. M00118]